MTNRNQSQVARTNEYFIPKEGIDRSVLFADICLYLGNDALVRPGSYEVTSNVLSYKIIANLF